MTSAVRLAIRTVCLLIIMLEGMRQTMTSTTARMLLGFGFGILFSVTAADAGLRHVCDTFCNKPVAGATVDTCMMLQFDNEQTGVVRQFYGYDHGHPFRYRKEPK